MKKNKIIKIFSLIMLLVLLTGCTNNTTNMALNTEKNKNKKEEKIDYIEEINVYNAAEYMDMSTVKDFERQYKIKVNYDEFESNESMYGEIVSNPNKYDVLVPSDYMIDRLIKENRVEKIDKSNIPNISNIAEEYLYPEYDQENEYVVPYMTGTLGILYNRSMVKENVDSWDIL